MAIKRNSLLILALVLIYSCNNNEDGNIKDIDTSLIKYIPPPPLNFDTLKKYSYLVYADINDSLKPNGTGFFIRDKGKLYFVSALHVFLGLHGRVLNIQSGRYVDTLHIVTQVHGDTALRYMLPLDHLRTKFKSFSPYKIADVYAYELDERDFNVPIYSIEKFIDTTYDVYKIRDAITCGYPAQETFARQLLKPPLIVKESIYGYYWEHNHLVGLPKAQDDTINYETTQTVETEGYSGSPVFLVYGDKLIFGGLITMLQDVDKWVGVVRPEKVLAKLKQIESISTK